MNTNQSSFDPDKQAKIRLTWERLLPISDQAADLFYDNLFDLYPNLALLFQNTDMPSQKKHLIHAIDAVVNTVDRLDEMQPLLRDLGIRHQHYGVEDAHYDAAGTALLKTLGEGLGDAWNSSVESAWASLYAEVSGVMRGAVDEPLAATA